MSEYWTICAEEALEDIAAAPEGEKVTALASAMAMAHECYGEQHGHVEASKALWADQSRTIERLQGQLSNERDKVPCPVCAGKVAPGLGGTVEAARYSCWACDKTGKVDPERATDLGGHP